MATPMQEQFAEVKRNYPDALVLFRLGDFYETFDEDAKRTAKILGITLTGRGQGENRRPMAGIPHHALKNYLPKLVAAGCKVVLVDQISEPQPGKLVEREVTDIITPGAIIDENLLEENRNNYLGAINIFKSKKYWRMGAVLVDIGTNESLAFEFMDTDGQFGALKELFARYQIKEMIVSEKLLREHAAVINNAHFPGVELFTKLPDIDFASAEAAKVLEKHWGLNSLRAWGISQDSPVLGALNALHRYLVENLKKSLILDKLTVQTKQEVNLPWNTIKSLELLQDSRGSSANSLFNHLNQTRTPAGKRKLYQWLLSPTNNLLVLQYRHNSVEKLISWIRDSEKNEALIFLLEAQPDYERFWTKAGYGRLKPHDLYRWAEGVKAAANWQKKNIAADNENKQNGDVITAISAFPLAKMLPVAEEILEAVVPGLNDMSSPGFINPDYDPELKALVSEANSGDDFLKNLQEKESVATGIPTLKVKFNKVFGYYIEISKSQLTKVPASYIRKQTLVNAERFITEELKQWEERILNIVDIRLRKEREIFQRLLEKLPELQPDSLQLGDIISELDVLTAFAIVADRYHYVRPVFNGEKGNVSISDVKHPILLARLGENFVANDLTFTSADAFKIITGPNMAGKSTFIRSVAILQVMAQIGCYVPASKAQLNLVDGIYTRVGASDNLSQNESTFMVEMVEMGYILKNATEKSLIILDEVGRGTSTYDGVSLAWSLVEHLSQSLKAFTLFATHYHELTQLEKNLAGVKNYYVEVIPREKLFFTHKVKPGALNKSFGVAVAQMAGIDKKVIKRAAEILKVLEKDNDVKHVAKLELNYNQLGLLGSNNSDQLSSEDKQKLDEFAKILRMELDKITPLSLVNKISELQELFRSE